MTQISGSYSIVVNPATTPPPALAITPASGALPAETEGQAVSDAVFATVSGGVPPYNYGFTGLPPGVTVNEAPSADGVAGDADLSLAGTPNVGDSANSPFTLGVTVTDSATPAASASFRGSVKAPAARKVG